MACDKRYGVTEFPDPLELCPRCGQPVGEHNEPDFQARAEAAEQARDEVRESLEEWRLDFKTLKAERDALLQANKEWIVARDEIREERDALRGQAIDAYHSLRAGRIDEALEYLRMIRAEALAAKPSPPPKEGEAA